MKLDLLYFYQRYTSLECSPKQVFPCSRVMHNIGVYVVTLCKTLPWHVPDSLDTLTSSELILFLVGEGKNKEK